MKLELSQLGCALETSPIQRSRRPAAREEPLAPESRLESPPSGIEHGEVHASSHWTLFTRKRRMQIDDVSGDPKGFSRLISCATQAQAALLVVDTRLGLDSQARRHARLAAMLGIRSLLVAANKVDTATSAALDFKTIDEAAQALAAQHGLELAGVIPVSAVRGDNVGSRSPKTPWYTGPSLLASLDNIADDEASTERLLFPVQRVRQHGRFANDCAGSVISGVARVGDVLRVARTGQTARLNEITTADGTLEIAAKGSAITIRLERDLDLVRGDVLSHADQPIELTDQFEASLVWLSDEAGHAGRTYDLLSGTQCTKASLTKLKHRLDPDTDVRQAVRSLSAGDLAVCTVATNAPIAFDSFDNTPSLGRFMLVDRYTRTTVAAGLIRHSLRRARNVHRQSLSIQRADRERLNGHPANVIWLTGLSGSGKSTIANALESALYGQGRHTYILDGDNIRQGLNKDLGFTDADRVENIRRVAEVANLMADAGLIVITAFISPFRQERDMARTLIGAERFREIHLSTPLEVCETRDPKGLYRKARDGSIPNMTGISSPYEPPVAPDLRIDTSQSSVDQAVRMILSQLGPTGGRR
ncbi:bifunctional enzyme CysN/CysC [Niveibacterium umoris]|uniref:Adenylyl-sulfate kinase n=2 Tax=Niveibacterium umoris TaxID=1193620 RepID=A0A840BHW1_9RHOO|nr:bifunctional enzyme CysN/CysC [Niveibacterium umoris]